jgi:hypothetical protein
MGSDSANGSNQVKTPHVLRCIDLGGGGNLFISISSSFTDCFFSISRTTQQLSNRYWNMKRGRTKDDLLAVLNKYRAEQQAAPLFDPVHLPSTY